MSEKLVQIQAELVKYESRSHGSLRLVFDSQEGVLDEIRNKIIAGHEKLGHLSFLPEERELDALDVINLPKIEYEKGEKSPSTRLRAVLFVFWKEKKMTITFEEFYRSQLEKYIESVKQQLP